ncbi:MAG: hypothetical protein WKF77_18525 [Planctomycetaceae bacterium]
MMGRWRAIMSIVLLTAGVLCADEPQQETSASDSAAVTRDIIYFYREHPIFIRVRIEIDQTPFERSWIAYVESLFAELDLDGDGSLRLEEISVPSSAGSEGPSPEAVRLARDPDLWSADRSPFDQAITIDELTAFLVVNGRGPFQAVDAASVPVSNDSVGTTLFGLLDLNSDHILSSEELELAMKTLRRRDLDDDGTFGTTELGASGNPYVATPAAAPAESPRPFAALTPGSAPIAVLRELERRYAQNPSVSSGDRSTLSRVIGRQELGLEADVFDQYDFDKDGRLDRDELRELIRRPPPTLELVVRLGTRAEGAPVVEMIGTAKRQNIVVRRSADGLASIVIDDVQIEIAQAMSGPDVAQQYLLGQFAAADLDKNNYLDANETVRSSTFRESFAEFDEDSDGKLFENELTVVVDGRMKAARSRTRMDINSRGRNLFEILDSDRNRSLSHRELAQAVKRIELWDADGDRAVSEAEIPQLYQISFGPGQPEFRGVQIPGEAKRSIGETASAFSAALMWFERLDRNGDGELTRREFPGTIAEFQKIDQNSDGVVDTAEATFVK